MREDNHFNRELVIIHRNGDVRRVQVEAAYRHINSKVQRPVLMVRFGIAGEYTISLETGEMLKARDWCVQSLRTAWLIWYDLVHIKTDKEKRELIPKECQP